MATGRSRIQLTDTDDQGDVTPLLVGGHPRGAPPQSRTGQSVAVSGWDGGYGGAP